jgi:hypothetical protein
MLKYRLYLLFYLLLFSTLTSVSLAETPPTLNEPDLSQTFSPPSIEDLATLPLYFEQNLGQTDAQAHYLARSNGYTLYLTSDGMVFSLPVANLDDQTTSQGYGLLIDFINANPDPIITGENPNIGTSNYFIGNDEEQWINQAQHYANIRYTGLYDGIDAVFYGNQSRLQYDFIVAPYADPSQIRLNFNPADHIELLANGDLSLSLPNIDFTIQAPYTYQIIDGVEREVTSHFVLEDGVVHFELGDYDPSQTLVIDPIVYGTYLGGSSNDSINDIVVDNSGIVYITGSTESTNFPVISGYDATHDGDRDVFVTKFDSVNSQLIFSTYLGGTAWEIASQIQFDNTGIYIAGMTQSSNYPRRTPYQNSLGGTMDGFVTKINPAGTELIYSTFLGGNEWDHITGLAIDSSGHAYVTGHSASGNFPTTSGAYNRSFTADARNPFLAKLSPAGNSLVYSTGFGIFGDSYGVDVDSSGNAYVIGNTGSSSLPATAGVFQSVSLGYDAFVIKMNPSASAIVYATYIGSQGTDYGRAIAVDNSGNAYVVGYVYGTGMNVTPGAFQTTFAGSQDTFAVKLNPIGAGIFSTYIGGSADEAPTDVTYDNQGNMYVTGSTSSTNFPTTIGAYQSTNLSTGANSRDSFIVKLHHTNGSGLYSSYIGGASRDEANTVAIDNLGNVYIAGYTNTSNANWITSNAYQSTRQGTGSDTDGFLVKMRLEPIQIVEFSAATASGFEGNVGVNPITSLTLLVTGNTNSPARVVNLTLTNGTATSADDDYRQTSTTITIPAGNYSHIPTAVQIPVSALGIVGDTKVEVNETLTLTLTNPSAGLQIGDQDTATYTITNDDSANVSINDVTVIEGNAGTTNATFTVSLSNPVDVPISLTYTTQDNTATAPNDYTSASGTVTFPIGITTQTLNVSVNSDYIDEGTSESFFVNLSNLNAGTRVVVLTDTQGIGTITDDDLAGVTISKTSVNVAESGTTDTFTIVLNSQPTAQVGVNLTLSDGAPLGASVTPSNVVFMPSQWNTPQTVTVNAIDDTVVEGAHTDSINFAISSSDTIYNNLSNPTSITVNITDDDTAGITVTGTPFTLTEGGTQQTFYIAPDTPPTSAITINLTTDGQCTTTPTVVTLVADGTASIPVLVNAVDDTVVEGAHTCLISISDTASADSFYNGIEIDNITVNMLDNDAQFNISASQVDVNEGTTTGNTFSFVVTRTGANQLPASVNLGYSGDAVLNTDFEFTSVNVGSFDGTTLNMPANVSSATLTYTTLPNWVHQPDRPLTVTLSNPTITGTATLGTSSADTLIVDDETLGITVSVPSVMVAEGGTDASLTIVLNTEPKADVTVDLSLLLGASYHAQIDTPTPLTFTSTNWNVPQTIIVSAIDDELMEGNHSDTLSFAVTSIDSDYEQFPVGDVTIYISDNDTAGITLSDLVVAVTEGGTDASLTTVLNTEPKADVTVDLSLLLGASYHAQIDTPTPLTFTSTNWNVPQTITVSAIDDELMEGNHSDTLSFAVTSTDSDYEQFPVGDVTIYISDNDTAGITLSDLVVAVAEGGTDASLTIVLNTEPKADVIIDLSLLLGAPYHAQIDTPTTLTFTVADWNVPQTITLSAIDDELMEGDHSDTLAFVVTSADSDYEQFVISDVPVAITDNDTAGVTVSESSITLVEGGAEVTLTVVLNTEPSDEVIVTISTPSSELTINPTTLTLTFDATNWNIPQTISAQVPDNDIVDGNRATVLQYQVASDDTGYDAITVSETEVNITDDDTPNAVISTDDDGVPVNDDGTYDLSLTIKPSDNVTITITVENEAICTVEPKTLTFTPDNYNVPQQITITTVGQSGEICVIHHTPTGGNYDDVIIPDVTYVIPARPQIDVFDPALSKIGLLLPGQLGLEGERLEWVTTVTNQGTGAGINVIVTDNLRPELRIDRVEAPNATVTINGQLVTITYPRIEAGQRFDFSIFTTVLNSDVEIDNTVCLRADNIGERCVTSAGIVGTLPATGETPLWAQLWRDVINWTNNK